MLTPITTTYVYDHASEFFFDWKWCFEPQTKGKLPDNDHNNHAKTTAWHFSPVAKQKLVMQKNHTHIASLQRKPD